MQSDGGRPPWSLRCPGYHASDSGRHDHHATWTLRASNPPERRYHCDTCGAHYPYLVDMTTTPWSRYTTIEPLGAVHPDDTNDYVDA